MHAHAITINICFGGNHTAAMATDITTSTTLWFKSNRQMFWVPTVRQLHGLCALGPFLTAMTFDSIWVELYMTKFSFLTAYFLVVWAPKKLLTCFHVEQFQHRCQLIACRQYTWQWGITTTGNRYSIWAQAPRQKTTAIAAELRYHDNRQQTTDIAAELPLNATVNLKETK